MGTSDAVDAERTLAEVQRLRGQARARAHGGAWLPAGLVGVLLLAGIALYEFPFGNPSLAGFLGPIEHPAWAGLPDVQRSPVLSYLFWFLGVPILFALTGLWYRHRARRHGIRINWWLFAGVGMAALLALAVLAAVPTSTRELPGEGFRSSSFLWSGLLTPLLAVAIAVIALGVVERSRALIAAGVWVAAITTWQCTSDGGLGTIPGWVASALGGFQEPSLGGQVTLLGLDRPGGTLIVMAAPLLVFALVGALRARKTQ